MNSEDVILDCYRLAKYYQLHPQVFLDMTISEIDLHLQRTIQLENIRRKAAEPD